MSKQFSKKTRDSIFEMYKACGMCNIELQNDNHLLSNYMQLDHLISKKKGGSNKKENLRALCNSCNSSKGDRSTLDIALKIKKDSSALFRDYHTKLIQYELKNNIINIDEFTKTLELVTYEFINNINLLLKEVRK